MTLFIKALANVQAAAPPVVAVVDATHVPRAQPPTAPAAPEDKITRVSDLAAAALKAAKDAVSPMLALNQQAEANKTDPEKEQVQQPLTQNVTRISDGLGNINILKAQLVAEQLPKEEGKVATAAEIDGLNSATAVNRAKVQQQGTEMGIA